MRYYPVLIYAAIACDYNDMTKTRFLPSLRAASLALLAVCLCGPAQAAGKMIIRDTEIEKMLRDWTEPVIRGAGLQPDAVNFILVQDSDINAFVAGGPNVFIYTGLLERSDNAGEVVGVIAHELGHISGGHLVRARGAMETASYESLLGMVLGLGAALASGDGNVGAAVGAGSQAAAMNRYLSFSRVQESSADQAALAYMGKAGINPVGLKTFMEKMETQELLPASQQNEYMRTHPLTRNRIDAMTAGYERSANRDKPLPAAWAEQHARMLAKLRGFIAPERVAWDYDPRDTGMASRYARAIAAYRQNNTADALRQMDELLRAEPDNPYFHELKGQMLVDFGRVQDALPSYSRALALDADAPLIRIAYAHALIEASDNQRARLDEAIGQLNRAVRDEPRSSRIYRLLATAYGRKGQEQVAKLYLAEEAILKRDYTYARRQAESALPGLEKGSREWIRAQDILNDVQRSQKKDTE